jgi:glutathione S-transferase
VAAPTDVAKRGLEVTQPYRIFGSELSPYSVKVRSYFRFKGIPHRWILRSPASQEEFQRHARLPLIPLVVTPADEGLQDSTPLVERLEERFPEPPLQPADPSLAFLSALLEEYADEWGNKWMFHYRWWYEADQISAAARIAEQMAPGADEEERRQVAQSIRERMVPRLSFVGSSEATRGEIEASFVATVDLLEAHLATRLYLFGERPVLADFGLWGQLYETSTDPTPSALLRERAPRVLEWVERMLDPADRGGLEEWSALAPTLAPLLSREAAGRFLPWSDANARALAAGEETFRVELREGVWEQRVQKYHARSLGELRRKYGEIDDRSSLDPILEDTGCRRWLASS